MTEHDVLCAAKSYLLNHGWVQRSLGEPGGPRCLLGAFLGYRDMHDMDAMQKMRRAKCVVLETNDFSNIVEFNNSPYTTFADVVAAIDRAILATAPAETPEPVKETVPA